jgi:hypothetical protein
MSTLNYEAPHMPNAVRGFLLERTGWDSNPRYAFTYTHFPGVRLKPLGHPSKERLSFNESKRAGGANRRASALRDFQCEERTG